MIHNRTDKNQRSADGSRGIKEQRERQKTRRLILGTAILILAAGIAGGFAMAHSSREKAREEQQREQQLREEQEAREEEEQLTPEEEKARFIDVEWEDLKVGKEYDAEIILNGIDRRGLFSDISRACEDMDVDLTGVNAKATKDGDATMTLTVKISSTQQMQKVLRTLRNIEGVTSVYRARS